MLQFKSLPASRINGAPPGESKTAESCVDLACRSVGSNSYAEFGGRLVDSGALVALGGERNHRDLVVKAVNILRRAAGNRNASPQIMSVSGGVGVVRTRLCINITDEFS